MNKPVRLKQLEHLINERDFVTIEEICSTFGIHINTARSDVKELVKIGVAEKRYGGVVGVNAAVPTSFTQRVQAHPDAKQEIGAKAAALLEENDVVFVDAGTTTASIFSDNSVLPKHITVISNNIRVVNWVLDNTDYACFVLPGKCDRQMNSLTGLETIASIQNYNIHKAFLGCRMITPDGFLTSASSIDAKIKENILARSQQKYLMADAAKVGAPELYTFARIEQFNAWISDKSTQSIVEITNKYNIRII